MNLKEGLEFTLAGSTLTRSEAKAIFSRVLGGQADPIQFGGLLVAMAQRGETAEEVIGAAEALREAAVPFNHDHHGAIDTCGTGGDRLGTFNLSTAAAIVAAAAGARVIKHGNRSVSSECGSADLLEAAGVVIDLEADPARRVLDEVGVTFLFAPTYHPAMRFAAPVRKALGVRTIFNDLGPLCNPGGVRRQLVGVSDPDRIGLFVEALETLGCQRGYVAHGGGGADELTIEGDNIVAPVGDVPEDDYDPDELGLGMASTSLLEGGDAAKNLEILGRLLAGERCALRDALAINAGCALVIAGVAEESREGVGMALDTIDSGAARSKLEAWVQASRGARE